MASAVSVPFYAGLDVGRYLWNYNTSVRDSLPYDIVDWLRNRAEWKRLWGRDHFFVAGRIAWYLRRPTENQPNWGNKLMPLPESMNMSMLSIETSSYCNEFAVPYPTYFHPSTYIDVIHWQKQVRSRKRRYLFSFAGAPHPTMNDSIRVQIINQCLTSKNTCKFLDCNSRANKCGTPVQAIKVFRNSIFCLQPPGDSYTRCLMFDSILAGCIPRSSGSYEKRSCKANPKGDMEIPSLELRMHLRLQLRELLREWRKLRKMRRKKRIPVSDLQHGTVGS
ncbi:hypothetical protein Gorai_005996 [Gossypium raimondii]|uniref:Exostosin GT47 domain-containing protein n=1 Tax=Gossypium raimondii TaxID=29730 RepID=A0A7J8QE38_GOSRA|nr:hypothetical protein [Gossypium raimondii]